MNGVPVITYVITIFLTMLAEKDLMFHSFSTRMTGWLLLIFFICLHNQLSSIHSIIFADVFHQKNVIQIDSKNGWLLLSASFTAKFCLNTGNRFFLEVSFSSQQKVHRFFYKTVLGIFKIALHWRDRHGFM